MNLISALVSDLVEWLLLPVIAWVVQQVLGRIPCGPFLALTPATTAFGRSASVAAMLTGCIWIVAALSSGSGGWLTMAFMVAAVVAVGGGLAYATLWWPACLTATFLVMAIELDWLPHLSPFAVRVNEDIVHTLAIGSFGIVLLAFLTAAIAIDTLRPRTPPERSPNNPWGRLGKAAVDRPCRPDQAEDSDQIRG